MVQSGSLMESTVMKPVALDIYPNPVIDRTMLRLENDRTGLMKIEVINMQGAVQKQFSINKTQPGAWPTYLSLGDIPRGNYILRVSMNDWTETRKIVRQ